PVERVAFRALGMTVCTETSTAAGLWSAGTGQPLCTAFSLPSRFHAGVLISDGRFAQTGGGTGNSRRREAAAGLFAPDGKTILTGNPDGSLQFRSVATGQRQGRPFSHKGGIHCAAISPDGKMILTGHLDNTARLWDAGGQPLGQPLLHPGPG